MPGSSNLFISAHASGQLYVYNEELGCGAAPPHYQLFKQGDGYSIHTCRTKSTRNPLYRYHSFVGMATLLTLLATTVHNLKSILIISEQYLITIQTFITFFADNGQVLYKWKEKNSLVLLKKNSGTLGMRTEVKTSIITCVFL